MKTATINASVNTRSTFEKVGETWAMIRVVCHFIPVICSLVWLVYYAFEPANFVADYILFPLLVVGWVSAIIACPLRFLKATFGLALAGLKLGWVICPLFPMCIVTALFGGALGLMGGILLGAFAPAIVTIYAFFKD